MVSIIVPIYKVEQYLARCIESILAQTFTDFELILVDDGSPDKCPAICDSYAAQDSRIVVLHLPNGGVSKARNAGLDIATGTYIAFCDGDDWWEPNLLACAMEKNRVEQWDWVSFYFRAIDDNGIRREFVYPASERIFNNWDEKIQFMLLDFLHGRFGWEVWARLFKRDIIERYGIRFCETCENFAEDMSFCVKFLLCCNSIATIDSCLYNYYLRAGSMMDRSRTILKLHALNEVSYDICTFAKQHVPQKVYKQTVGIFHYLIMVNQYCHAYYSERYRTLDKEFKKIKRQDWFREGTLSTIRNKSTLKRLFGKNYTYRIMNFSTFCLHRNWYLFALGRKILNLVYACQRKGSG